MALWILLMDPASTISLLYPRVLHPQIQPTKDQKYLGWGGVGIFRGKKSRKLQEANLNWPHTGKNLHSIYIVFIPV